MEQSGASIGGESCAGTSGGSAAVGAAAVGVYGVLERVRGAVAVCSVPPGDRGVDEWMGLVGEVSAALTVLAAARDAAIVRLAAIEEVVTEDGVVGEQVNGLGTVCLDAGAMVSTVTGTSARFGEELVEQAVTRVVRVPALHEAMVAGVLDDYKARRLAGELGDVPPDLARAVLDTLAGELWTKSGPALARRARAILMSLCPDLLRERIRRARKGVGLRRWMGEPGTDSWGGSFPSERAATAWAAVDALARRYRLEGRYDTLEQARAYALMDLVDGSITVETVLHLSVPAEGLDAATEGAADEGAGRAPDVDGEPQRPGDVFHDSKADSQGGSDPGDRSAVFGLARASHDDRGHVACSGGVPSFSPQTGASDGRGGASEGVFVAVAGAQGGSLSWFPVTALRSCLGGRDGPTTACHPLTGALLDPGDTRAGHAYRPSEALKMLVRQRDGGCRFPGCTIAARQCDLDHVVPWPHGETTASNLICLCRRHHRVKQRHRWGVRLRADGVVEWIDPTGRHHLTEPVDHLGAMQSRVIDADAGLVGAGEFGAGDVGRADLRGGDGDDTLGGPVDPRGGGSSPLERVLALMVEQATAGFSAPRPLESAHGGCRSRSPAIVSGEELDEVSRAVRAGTFASLDDALEARESLLAEQARNERLRGATRGCRVDHSFPQGQYTVAPRRRHRHGHEPAPWRKIPPPPF